MYTKCPKNGPEASQTCVLKVIGGGENAKTAPAAIFPFFHCKSVQDSFKNQQKHFSWSFIGILKVCRTKIDGLTILLEFHCYLLISNAKNLTGRID